MTSLKTNLPGKGFAVVIPALNEAGKIAEVIAGVIAFAMPIVVDDGSDDATAVVAERAGAIVVRHAVNKGYDSALETGLFKAIDLGFEFAITFDADGQHDARTLIVFKEKLTSGADIVLGKRDKYQRSSEWLFGKIATLLWKVEDPLCGMKGYRLVHLAKAGCFDSYKSIGTEFTIRAAKSGLTIATVNIPTAPRLGVSRFGVGIGPNLKILRAALYGVLFTRKIY